MNTEQIDLITLAEEILEDLIDRYTDGQPTPNSTLIAIKQFKDRKNLENFPFEKMYKILTAESLNYKKTLEDMGYNVDPDGKFYK